jgi:hypothetical protein
MAKESGLGWTTLSVDDSAGSAVAIKNDVTNFSFATPREEFDWTGVDKSARERGLGLADFSIELNGIFNDAASQAHPTLKTIPSSTTIRAVSLAVSGQTLANECYGLNYDLERAANGNLTWKSTFMLADGAVPTWS